MAQPAEIERSKTLQEEEREALELLRHEHKPLSVKECKKVGISVPTLMRLAEQHQIRFDGEMEDREFPETSLVVIVNGMSHDDQPGAPKAGNTLNLHAIRQGYQKAKHRLDSQGPSV